MNSKEEQYNNKEDEAKVPFLESQWVKELGELDPSSPEFKREVLEMSGTFFRNAQVDISRAKDQDELDAVVSEANEVFGQGFMTEEQLKILGWRAEKKSKSFQTTEV